MDSGVLVDMEAECWSNSQLTLSFAENKFQIMSKLWTQIWKAFLVHLACTLRQSLHPRDGFNVEDKFHYVPFMMICHK